MFYVSPQVWAWRAGRVKKIKQRIDLMAVLFPFELAFYEKENIPACLVKHPLLEDANTFFNSAAKPKKAGMKIGLLPGSRKSEIKKTVAGNAQSGQVADRPA